MVVLWEVLTVRLWMTGTLMSGWVFRQKVRMEMQNILPRRAVLSK